jgi:hypothetical protein
LDTPKVILVEWIDAVCSAGWEIESKPELHPCTTLGYLITEDAEAVVIASTLSLGSNNARMVIPKAWIKKRKEIKIETPKRKSKRKAAPAVGEGQANNIVWTK